MDRYTSGLTTGRQVSRIVVFPSKGRFFPLLRKFNVGCDAHPTTDPMENSFSCCGKAVEA
jgi:hypothetical protein